MQGWEKTAVLTRIDNGEQTLEVVALDTVMRRIAASLQTIPDHYRRELSHALLMLAVCRMLAYTSEENSKPVGGEEPSSAAMGWFDLP